MDERNERTTGLALGWGGFAAAYLAAFFLTTALPTPLPWYFPVEHRVQFAVRVDGLAVDFYGRLLWCLLAGLVGFGLTTVLKRRAVAETRALWVTRLGAWCCVLFLFTAALYVYLLVGRHSPPVPFPAYYVPR